MYGNGRKRLLLGVATVLGIHSLVGHPFPCRHCYFWTSLGSGHAAWSVTLLEATS